MESGLTRFFLRKRSKSKPILIGEPLPSTFRQTVGYDEVTDGPQPTIGTRPIKPSEQKVKRKSFSHLRTKSAGLQEIRKLMQVDSGARPQTAPGTPPIPIHPAIPSNSRLQNRASVDEAPTRWKSVQAPPKIPDLPKGAAGISGPRHFDLLQAAVSSSGAEALPRSTRHSLDIYNENIADRNSLYGKSLNMPSSKHLHKAALTHRIDNAPPAENVDAQRASFDAMQASRNATTLAARTVTGSEIKNLPRSSPPQASGVQVPPLPENVMAEDLQGSERKTSLDFVAPRTSSERRRLNRQSARGTEFPAQLSPNMQGEANHSVLPLNPSSSPGGSRRLSGQKRSKAISATPSSENVLDALQLEKPVILILKPFGDGSGQMTHADDISLPSGSHAFNRPRGNSATSDKAVGSQTPGLASTHVPLRLSSDRSKRRREKSMRHSRESTVASGNAILGKVSSVKGSARRGTLSSKAGRPMTGGGSIRLSDPEDEDDYDVGIEEAVTHQADPVHILRASVVSAHDYVYKEKDNVIPGKVLHHRPSRSLSLVESTEHLPPVRDVNAAILIEGRSSTPCLISASSPSPPSISDSALQRPQQWRDNPLEAIVSTHTTLSPDPDPTSSHLRVSPRGASDKETDIREHDRPENLPVIEDSLQHIQREPTQSPASTHATVEATAPTKARSADCVLKVIQQQEEEQTKVAQKSDRGRDMLPPPPSVITRDFAQPQTLLGTDLPEVTGRLQSETTNHVYRLTNGRERIISLGGYIHIDRQELDSQGLELDRIIAVKKEAAARALLKLQEVMAMPSWEEPCNLGRSRASTKVPGHWRDLSIEDGSPIAPSSIFNKVKMPAFAPPISEHSTYYEHERRGLSQAPERSTQGDVEQNDEILNNARSENKVQASAAPCDISRPQWLENRGTDDTLLPTLKKSHSRVGSTMSATSGTSAYSLPHHMVPARGSSLRDGEGRSDDFGQSPNYHVGELGWQ